MLLPVSKARENLGNMWILLHTVLIYNQANKNIFISLFWNSWFLTEDLAFCLSLICVLAAKKKQVLKNISICFIGYIPYLSYLPIYAGLNISVILKSVAITSFKDPI